ncbi:MAG TPA: hypothetical protein VFZ28_08925, partial [Burkholderiaceae bacterium]|nr:hypothetical protein [Burkholderiaceae bacterium]
MKTRNVASARARTKASGIWTICAPTISPTLRLHLSGQAVPAVSHSVRYRAAKWLARHRGAAAVVFGVATLAMGLAAALWQRPPTTAVVARAAAAAAP